MGGWAVLQFLLGRFTLDLLTAVLKDLIVLRFSTLSLIQTLQGNHGSISLVTACQDSRDYNFQVNYLRVCLGNLDIEQRQDVCSS